MEGTTQGNPLAMPRYSLNTSHMINDLSINNPSIKQVWLADDASAAGKLQPLFDWYNRLIFEGRKHGYFVNGAKSWLILKSPSLKVDATKIFGNTVNITSEGKRHLGAVIGSDQFKEEYCDNLVQNWVAQLKVLCNIAETQPQAAYTAYTKGFHENYRRF